MTTTKARKAPPKKDKRVYPKTGDVLSTAAYVQAFYAANAFREDCTAFFDPLSTSVSQPLGVDACESV